MVTFYPHLWNYICRSRDAKKGPPRAAAGPGMHGYFAKVANLR